MSFTAFVTGKPKGPAFHQRSTDTVAVNVAVKGKNGTRGIEIVLRVEALIAQELIRRTVNGIGSRLRHAVYDDAGVAPILGRESVRLDLEFLDHVDIRLERDLVLHHVAQINAIEHVVRGI